VGAGWVRKSQHRDPQNAADQLGLALRLVGFFTANPSYEVASMKVTAAHGTTLRDAAVTSQQALATAVVALNNVSIRWQSAYDTLVGTMRSLIKILAASMGGSDPRWNAFGLNQPDANTTPGKPMNVTAHLDHHGNIVVQCDRESYATRYRWRMLRVGIATKYSLAASSVDPVGLIGSVLPGQTAQIIAQAVNGALQGVASDPIQFTVPPEVKAAAEPKGRNAGARDRPGRVDERHEGPERSSDRLSGQRALVFGWFRAKVRVLLDYAV
jgi:hypothetical protein